MELLRASALEGSEPPGLGALAEDLNGRPGHAWLTQANGHRRSTLDLLGRGLTLLAGPGSQPGGRRRHPRHRLPPGCAAGRRRRRRHLGVHPDGAVLARPDAQVIASWPTGPPDPRAELVAAISGWVAGGLVSSGAGTGRWRRGRRP
jgi:hypothetical protein